ncbi:hypothetical protein [Alkalimonas amylolytica]|uniref:Uncharacterized protein n=1 Tax=Alkalimonas amylolytica TaxID=152573 RepID=A0A1H3Z420_ALKAM|nr:hypothetical protein [Alkalimonas amylolytica]SEA18593.1 hypothetical protein SAMN04488051_10223 [Alkalimonas amylolytica]
MTAIQSPTHYTGIYVNDVWQNCYLLSKDLLTSYDLADSESVMHCPLQAEYFLLQIEPAISRHQILLDIYRYAQICAAGQKIPAHDQLLKSVAEVVAAGELRIFKVRDGHDIYD